MAEISLSVLKKRATENNFPYREHNLSSALDANSQALLGEDVKPCFIGEISKVRYAGVICKGVFYFNWVQDPTETDIYSQRNVMEITPFFF